MNQTDYETIFKLTAIGCYSFAASSLAIMVELMSGGSVPPEAARPLSRLAFTVVPLFACGLAMDFLQVGQPRNRPVGWVLFALSAALIGFSASSLQRIFWVYTSEVGGGFGGGIVFGFVVFIIASIVVGVLGRRKP